MNDSTNPPSGNNAPASKTPRRIIVGITGASGACYAVRVIELLAACGIETHIACSSLGRRLLAEEMGITQLDPDALSGGLGERLVIHPGNDVGAACASGSFKHDGMIVVPASSNTLAKIAYGISDNLVQRAAQVTLKERRPLVIAHRESPIGMAEIEAMRKATQAGAIVAPLSPGFYLEPNSIQDLVDFMAGRLLDLVGVDHGLQIRWDKHLESRRVRPE
ncbi:MAG: UbiX family flavin prenyltransferase [Phycisphaerales bacterium]|nr:UbiX family flavin prenyltransferase [Phycisphaerales bacterium]